MATDRLYGLKEVSEMLGIALGTMRRWASQKRVTTIRLGGRVLMRQSDIDRLIESNVNAAVDRIAV